MNYEKLIEDKDLQIAALEQRLEDSLSVISHMGKQILDFRALILEQSKIIASQAETITKQAETIANLQHRVSELESKLKENSSNSNRPPSADGLTKKPAIPRTKGTSRGGKIGHKGKTLELVSSAQVTNTVVYTNPTSQCECGCSLEKVEATTLPERRQVFDLPPIALQVTEHVVTAKTCPNCQKQHKGTFSDQVNAPVQYGNGVRALVSMLSVEHSMPVEGIKTFIENLFGYSMNEATIQKANKHLYNHLGTYEKEVCKQLEQANIGHFDETGARIEGNLHWIHTAVTNDLTYFFAHQKRGAEAIFSEESVLTKFKGTAVHDCWKTYWQASCEHSLCNSHILRELKALEEAGTVKWALRMHDLLMYAYIYSDCGKGVVKPAIYRRLSAEYDRIIQLAEKEEPPPTKENKGKTKQTKGRNLMNRLKERKSYVLAFAVDEKVPFTNNLAEQAVRGWKTKLKVAGCFRTMDGAKYFARIKGFCSTVKKQGLVVFDKIKEAISSNEFHYWGTVT